MAGGGLRSVAERYGRRRRPGAGWRCAEEGCAGSRNGDGRKRGAPRLVPPVHSPLPENSVPMGVVATFAEEKLDLPVTPGPYEPTWSSIEANYPGTPQ